MKHPSFTKTESEFFLALHGLRGIAILYVVVSHFGHHGLALGPVPHQGMGKVGVWIFFGLSAFLLTRQLYQDLAAATSKPTALLHYAIRRIFRIYPLYGLVLMLHALRGNLSWWGVLEHLMLRRGQGEFWAIPVEFQYYGLIPVIVLGALQGSRPWASGWLLAGLTATGLFGLTQPARVFASELDIIPKLAPFLLGSLLALWHDPTRRAPPVSPGWLAGLVPSLSLATLLIATGLFRQMHLGVLSQEWAPGLSMVLGLAVAGMMASAVRPTFIGQWLSVKPLVLLGQWSFGLYLLHLFAMSLVMRLPGVPTIFQAWLALGLSVGGAALAYWAIEQPGMRLGQRVAQALAPRLAPARPPTIQPPHPGP